MDKGERFIVDVRVGLFTFLATPPEGFAVGLDEVEGRVWSIYFCEVLIARFTERDHIIRR
ncbi:MAG: hypothetical protein ABIR59_04505 [Gemmatimonadales bacterium]